MSTTAPTIEQLTQLIIDKFGMDPGELHPDTVLEDADLDSLALVEIAVTVQKQFGVHVPTDDLKSGTLTDLHQVVLRAAEIGS